MKKGLLILVSIILSLLLLASCTASTSGADGLADIVGCYALVSAEYTVDGEIYESFSGEERLVVKIREDGTYLLLLDGRFGSGNAQLADGVLTLTGDPAPFEPLGDLTDLRIEFGAETVLTANLYRSGAVASFTARLARTGNYDDDFFLGAENEHPTFIGVRGLKNSYPPNGFTTDGVEVGFLVGHQEVWLPIYDTYYEVKTDKTEGVVNGEYMGCEYNFRFSLAEPFDAFTNFPSAEYEYTGEPIEHLPTLPEGYRFVPDGETSYINAGNYQISGTVYFENTELCHVSSELRITKKVIQSVDEVSFRIREDGKVPEDALDEMFYLEGEYFDVGENYAYLIIRSDNYCFADGSSSAYVRVVTLPALVPASDFEWVIPNDKITFRYDWTSEMPFLTYRGERVEGVVYNYEGGQNADGAAGEIDFVAGYYTVEADFRYSRVEADGDLPPCTVELCPVIISLPDSIEVAYTGGDVYAPTDFDGCEYVQLWGEYTASAVGNYSYTVYIPDYLFNSGAVVLENGEQTADVFWSIVKGSILLRVDTTSFDWGMTFEYDGNNRYFRAMTSPDAAVVMYVNGVRYESCEHYSFYMPGTYEVRIEVENDFYTAEPYETTVVINKKQIDVSDIGMTWGLGSFIYTGSGREVLLSGIPDYLGVSYSGNIATDAGDYRATATFYLFTPYDEIYELKDSEYVSVFNWEITPRVLELPTIQNNGREYTGNRITVFTPGYPADAATVTDASAINAGSYELVVTLTNNYVFTDGTREFRAAWSIKPKRVQLAPLALESSAREWSSGAPFTPCVYNLDRLYSYFDVTVEGDASAEEPGTYQAKYIFTPKEGLAGNYEFVYYDGGGVFDWQTPFEFSYEVLRAEITKPLAEGSYTYTGLEVVPTLAGFNSELMTLTTHGATVAGRHTVRVTVKDTAHYCFVVDGERVDSAEIPFEIGKASLTLQDFTQPIYTYDGKSHNLTVIYRGVGGERFAAIYSLYEDGNEVEAVLGAGYYRLSITGAEAGYETNYYEPTSRNITFTVGRATIDTSGFIWDMDEATYDGEKHSPTLIGGYPAGLEFTVSQNSGSWGGTEAGDYVYKVSFPQSDNYLAASATHDFRINRRLVTPPTLTNSLLVYNGGSQSPTVVAKDTDFGEYDYTVKGNYATVAGKYIATVTAGNNFLFLLPSGATVTELDFNWEIERAHHDLSALAWSGKEGEYPSNGTVYNFTLTGLPNTVTVRYSMGSVQKVGSYTKVATLVSIDEDNYYPPVPENGAILSFSFSVIGDTFGDYVYYVEANNVYITEYNGSSSSVALPANINGYPIYSVGEAFAGHSEIVTLDLTALTNGYGKLGVGSLSGLSSLYEIYMPAVAQGMMLSDIFGGQTPRSLEVIHASGLVGYYLSQLDCPTLKELYINVGPFVDLSGIVFDLDLLVIRSVAASYTFVLDWSPFDTVATVYSGSFHYGGGDYYTGYWEVTGPGVGFDEATVSGDSVVVIDGCVYLIESDGTAEFLRSRESGRVEIPTSVSYEGKSYTVDSIASYACCMRNDITELTVPSSIVHVGSQAFFRMERMEVVNWNAVSADCAGSISLYRLGTVNLGEGVISLPDDFMKDCFGLRELVMPSTLEVLGKGCFRECPNLIHLTVSPALRELGMYSFNSTPKLADIYDPAGVMETLYVVGSSDIVNAVPDSLGNHHKILHVYSDPSKCAISHSADGFYYLTYEGVKYIVGYDGDAYMVLPSSPHQEYYIAPYAFAYHRSITEAIVSSNYTEIPEAAFYECTALGWVGLGAGMDSIMQSAFEGCVRLDGVDIPDSLTQLDSAAFRSCTSLSSIDLPDTLEYLGSYVFDGCTSITEFRLPTSVSAVPAYLLSGCSSLTRLTLHSGVTVFDGYCFYGCSLLDEIEIPSGVTWIGSYTFSKTAIRSATIPASVETLGEGIFAECTALESVSILATITKIPRATFYGCTSLNMSLPTSLERIEDLAFYGCTSLNIRRIPVSVNYIGEDAFLETPVMAEADGQGLYIFDGWLLACVEKMKGRDVEIPAGVVGIASRAFGYAEIGAVTTPPTLLLINDNAFHYSTLTSIQLSEGLRYIGESAFMRCASLTEITIPDTVAHIGRTAFAYCESLEEVHVGGGVQELGTSIFSVCKRITVFTFARLGVWYIYDGGPEFDLTTNESALETLSNVYWPEYIYKK